MSMVIANNMQAVNTKRQFATSARGMSSAMEKLSSGYKINTGKDDPSGLSISETLRSQLNGLKRAQQNTEEAINVMGIAEGALNEMNSILKKMKALAIHSANTGVTTPDQIAADQAEMDSAIQTLDRIAQTTKFGDQNLLNGSKDITFDVDTSTKGTQQNSLLNARETAFSQIYKRDGYSVSINFTGTTNANSATGIGDVDFSQQAMKAYLEIDTAPGASPAPQVDKDGNFTQDQQFTLTGNKGSRSFKFKQGTSVADMVKQIKNSADSTGIDAALVFNSAQTINKANGGGTAVTSDQVVNVTGMTGKNGQAVQLVFSGTNADIDVEKMGLTIFASVTSGVASGAPGVKYTVISNDGNQATINVTSSGVVTTSGFTSGALAGVNIKEVRNLDLSKSMALASGVLSGGSLNTGSVSGIDLSGLSDKVKATLIGATEVKFAVTGVGPASGAGGSAEVSVTITGTDSTGKKFELTQTMKTQLSSGVNSGIEFTGAGDLTGLKFNLTASGIAGVAIGGGAVDLELKYVAADTIELGKATILKNQVDGIGNTSSFGSVGGISLDTGTAARAAGTAAVFNNTIDTGGTGAVVQGVTSVSFSTGAANNVQFGMNTDGQGRVYVKFLDDNSFELYKDSSMSAESLVATGINGQAIKEANNSGLKGLTLNLAGTDLASKKGVYIAMAGIEGENGVRYNQSAVNTLDPADANASFVSGAMFDASRTFITGIELGKNTSDDGQLFFKTVYDHDAKTVQVFAYKDKEMRDEDMVAKSEAYKTQMQTASGTMSDVQSMTIALNEIRNADNTAGTGLGIMLSVDGAAFAGQTKSTTINGDLTFTNLGARVYAQDYGSSGFVKITQDKGAIFHEYGTAGDNSSKRLIDAGSKGTTVQVNGQDATLSVNGMSVKTDGLKLKMATQDIQADLTFNAGKVGSTTLAQVGYGDGSIFTKIGALNLSSTQDNDDGLNGLLCNAGHVTNETVGNFDGGMQLQLGEGDGDQNRTVVAIKSLASNELGRVTKGGYWETGSAVWTERMFTMQDVMGGGTASLASDPILAMSIIDQAISDVTEVRAQIGAQQTNLLQTNSNNLSVTMENIQKTESGIRDADMADEMTEFTKQQVLQNAAMSMMSNANANAQNVLQLLR